MYIYVRTDEVLLRTSTTREVTLYQVARTWYLVMWCYGLRVTLSSHHDPPFVILLTNYCK